MAEPCKYPNGFRSDLGLHQDQNLCLVRLFMCLLSYFLGVSVGSLPKDNGLKHALSQHWQPVYVIDAHDIRVCEPRVTHRCGLHTFCRAP